MATDSSDSLQEAVDELTQRVQEQSISCVDLSELSEMAEGLGLSDDEGQALQEALEQRGLEVRDDCGRERVEDTRYVNGEMAERIAHLAWMQRRERVGINADMVAKWERGAKGISPRYRELLCSLFGVTPEQLGLKSTPAPAGGIRSRVDDQSLVAMLDRAAGLLDQGFPRP